MKKYNFLLLVFIFTMFINGSCENQDGHRFIIQNNSEQEIIILTANFSMVSANHNYTPMCLKPMTDSEYNDLIFYNMIKPHSNKNFERQRFGDNLINNPNDTLYICIFNRIDIDTMTCAEFDQKFPLKREWKITLTDMEVCDWTLVYEPEE